MADPLDLDALDRLLAAATIPPWRTLTDGDGNTAIVQTAHLTRDVWQIPRSDEDLEAIVALRNAAPQMLSELRALRRVAEAAKEYRFNCKFGPNELDERADLKRTSLAALDAALKEAGL